MLSFKTRVTAIAAALAVGAGGGALLAPSAQAAPLPDVRNGQVCNRATQGVALEVYFGGTGERDLVYPRECTLLHMHAYAWRPPVGYMSRWHFAEDGISNRTCRNVWTQPGQWCATVGGKVEVTGTAEL